MTIRVLLLQVRNADDPMREHEHHCFVTRTGLVHEDVVPFDTLSGAPSYREVRSYDAVMVGGSGDYCVSKRDQPNLDRLLDLLGELVDRGHPTFASCYGFQAMVHALGGEIIHDPDNTEVGTFELELTEHGARDELFGALPRVFHAQQGHKDRATRLPDGLANFASSERSPLQAFRVPGKPVWACQFHPELDRHANELRYRHYLDAYAGHLTEEEKARSLERFQDSPEASALLRRFVEHVFR